MFRQHLQKIPTHILQSVRILLGAIVWLSLARAVHADTAPWVLIDTSTRSLSVMEGGETRELFQNISYGRGGVADVRFRGDHKTPRGEFHVLWVNHKSPFRLFFGLDYPNDDYVKKALDTGRIDWNTYVDIRMAMARKRFPPQNTLFGGNIGIHGLGRADPDIHKEFNWTQGCIALTNDQIERLSRWVQVGTRVVIR